MVNPKLFPIVSCIMSNIRRQFHESPFIFCRNIANRHRPPPTATHQKSYIQMVITNMPQNFQLFFLSSSTSPQNIPQITPLLLESFAAYTEKLIKECVHTFFAILPWTLRFESWSYQRTTTCLLLIWNHLVSYASTQSKSNSKYRRQVVIPRHQTPQGQSIAKTGTPL